MKKQLNRRQVLGKGLLFLGAASFWGRVVRAETFLSIEQAQIALWGEATRLSPVEVALSKEQVRAIEKASGERVRNPRLRAWRSEEGDWFLVDQVLGKHEFIDLAVAITRQGKVQGIEVLTYRETYGGEIREPRWRAQFQGRDGSEVLKLDQQIRNISGATLSCRHVTDGVNRLLQTWSLVLRHL